MNTIRILTFAFLAFTIAAAAHADVDVGQPAPDFTLPSAGGEEVSLDQFKGKYVVLEWTNYGCPFVKKFYQKSGKMPELQQEYKGKDVVWLTICSSAPGNSGYHSASEALKANKQQDWAGSHYLIDSHGKVGRAYGATNTPNMFVINPEGEIIYMGAIDSKKSVDPADIDGATNYVAAALDAAMQGKAPATPKSKPYGCSVKY